MMWRSSPTPEAKPDTPKRTRDWYGVKMFFGGCGLAAFVIQLFNRHSTEFPTFIGIVTGGLLMWALSRKKKPAK